MVFLLGVWIRLIEKLKIWALYGLALFMAMASQASENEVLYLHDPEQAYTFESVPDADFSPYQKPINQGLDNGVFWIKVEPSTVSFIQFENTHVQMAIAQQNHIEIQPLPSNHYLTFELKPGLVLVRLEVSKQAYIPIKITQYDAFLKQQQSQGVVIGMFYGFALMVLILNLFFYFSFKEKTFILYCAFLVSVMITFAHRDGFLHMLGFSNQFLDYSEGFSHFLAGFTGAFFASEYLQMRRNTPTFLKIMYVFVAFSLALDFVYLFTDEYVYNAFSDVAILYVFVGSWLVSVRFAKRYTYALLFSIAYSLIVVLILDFYLFAAFGFYRLGIDANLLKLGGYFEMLIITAAVLYRMRVLQAENHEMRSQIENHLLTIEQLVIELKQNQMGEPNHFSQYDFSHRENEILQLIANGQSNQAIADQLHISVNTVKYHVKNIYQKLNISRRKDVLKVLG